MASRLDRSGGRRRPAGGRSCLSTEPDVADPIVRMLLARQLNALVAWKACRYDSLLVSQPQEACMGRGGWEPE
jgi:hypothetical protein